MCLAHCDSHGRLVEISNKSRGAKSDWRAVSRKSEGRDDSSDHLDRIRNKQGSGNDIGNLSNRAFHSGQSGDGFTMVQSHSHDDLLERSGHLSLEISISKTIQMKEINFLNSSRYLLNFLQKRFLEFYRV